MSKPIIGRPEATEFADFQTAYISKIPGADIMTFLREQIDAATTLLRGVDEDKGNYRYAPEKWSVKELLGHAIDTERVFAYRALVFSRNDNAELPGFEESAWAKHAGHGTVPLQALLAEFETVRRATIYLFGNLDGAAWMRSGTADNRHVSVRALAYLIAGHTQHHLDILKSRYLNT
jgi:hypothetical protein